MAGSKKSWLGIVVALALVAWPASAAATFPGTNGKIAFSAQSGVWTINPDGSDLTRLTSTDVHAGYPAWSATGKKIAFAEDRGVGAFEHNWDVGVMNANGTGKQYLTNSVTDERYPTFSPDGTKIVFARRNAPDPGSGLIMINSDGSGEHALTTNPATGDSSPEWSPNGKKIVFTRERPSDNVGTGNPPGVNPYAPFIWTVNPNGTGARVLTPEPQFTTGDFQPSWSPDSSRILFFRFWRQATPYGPLPINSPTARSQPAVMDASGTNLKLVSVDSDDASSTFPTWSPDGAKVALHAGLDLATGDYDTSGAHPQVTNLNRIGPGAFPSDVDWQSGPPRPKAPSLCELFGIHEQISEPAPLKLSFCLP